MSVEKLNASIAELSRSIDQAVLNHVNPFEKPQPTRIMDFKLLQLDGYRKAVFSNIAILESEAKKLYDAVLEAHDNQDTIDEIQRIVPLMKDARTVAQLRSYLDKAASFAAELKPSASKCSLQFSSLPIEIKTEVLADFNEAKRCFDACSYRSCVILCGRILETALHRKYFEATGNDLLEKSPGIGLGNLIAKLAEKGIATDPGLTNQIHLINQVRISSVHKSASSFTPSREQAQAIMLYTIDAVNKLFS